MRLECSTLSWIRVDLARGSHLLVDDLMVLPAKLRIRRLLLLIHTAGSDHGGWSGEVEKRSARAATASAGSGLPTIRLKLGADCPKLAKDTRRIPRESRETALIALAESGLRTLRHREFRERMDGASVSREALVTLAAIVIVLFKITCR